MQEVQWFLIDGWKTIENYYGKLIVKVCNQNLLKGYLSQLIEQHTSIIAGIYKYNLYNSIKKYLQFTKWTIVAILCGTRT